MILPPMPMKQTPAARLMQGFAFTNRFITGVDDTSGLTCVYHISELIKTMAMISPISQTGVASVTAVAKKFWRTEQ